ncbi:MAG: hypothetical protein COA84_07920 [Robiginitomaculum sp.]|nr:MAG: hypothetical protein COA84_07920 [Robiginitomaculum sp.]
MPFTRFKQFTINAKGFCTHLPLRIVLMRVIACALAHLLVIGHCQSCGFLQNTSKISNIAGYKVKSGFAVDQGFQRPAMGRGNRQTGTGLSLHRYPAKSLWFCRGRQYNISGLVLLCHILYVAAKANIRPQASGLNLCLQCLNITVTALSISGQDQNCLAVFPVQPR